MKTIKIKWNNIFKFLIMIVCLCVVLYDFYVVSISQFFTGELVGWSWFGFISFFVCFFISGTLYDSLFNKEVL
jgi:1,4-dihydroxy-2-naphthoate octaprenyltransferase